MPLHATSYFAGVGTVVATIALGFGGGVMLTDAFIGKSENAPTLIERRAASQPQPPPPVLAAVPASRADEQPQPPAPHQAVAAEASPALQQPAQPNSAPVPASQAAAPVAQEQSKPEQSFARANDRDLKARDAEVRKAAGLERRKQERRKWAARRKQDMQKIDELAAVSEKVKQAERERQPVFRAFAAESPVIAQPPVVNLFGGGDDD